MRTKMDGEGNVGPMEVYPEAAAILRDAGWAPHNRWDIYTRGTGVMGFAPDGSGFHHKDWMQIPPGDKLYGPDYPDTAVEAAQWLVTRFPKPAPVQPMADNPLSLASLEPAPEPANDATPILESEAAGEAPEAMAGAIDSGDESVAVGDAGSVEDGPASGGGEVLVVDGPAQSGDSDAEIDYEAEFEEIGEAELIEAEARTLPLHIGHDLGAEILEQEQEEQGGVVYFGDDIHVARLAKLGRMMEIATEKKVALQDGWTLDEFRSLQNLIVRMTNGEAPDDPDARARFNAINDRSRAMSAIDAYLNGREQELEGYAELMKAEETREEGRAAIVTFDPEAGWPQ